MPGYHLVALVHPDLIWNTAIGLMQRCQKCVTNDRCDGKLIGDIVAECRGDNHAGARLQAERQVGARLLAFFLESFLAYIFHKHIDPMPVKLVDDDGAIKAHEIRNAKVISKITPTAIGQQENSLWDSFADLAHVPLARLRLAEEVRYLARSPVNLVQGRAVFRKANTLDDTDHALAQIVVVPFVRAGPSS